MTITYSETTNEDISNIKCQSQQEIGYGLDQAVDLGISETMWAGDTPVAAYGMVSLWEGNASIWALLSEEAKDNYGITMTRRIREMLESMIDTLELVRVQATARCDHKEARDWLEHFGFHVEGTMEAYGPEDQADYYMMARIIDGEVH